MGITNRAKEKIFAGHAFFVVRAGFHGPRAQISCRRDCGWTPSCVSDYFRPLTRRVSNLRGGEGLILGSIYFVTSTIQLYGARYVGRRIESLKEYVESTLAPNLKVDVSRMYELRGPIILFVVLAGTALPAYYILYDIPVAVQLIQLTCWGFFSFVFATFFSAYGHSMYKIYEIGKLPLQLKPFTEDRTLGLKPFGRTSLQLSLLYFFLVSSSFIPFSISYNQ